MRIHPVIATIIVLFWVIAAFVIFSTLGLHAQPTTVTIPPPTPNPPFINCLAGGLVWMNPLPLGGGPIGYHCIDPKAVSNQPSKPFTGIACTPPGTGAAIPYAKLPDGSCLPIIVVPMAGSTAQIVTASSDTVAQDGSPAFQVIEFFTTITPTPPAQ